MKKAEFFALVIESGFDENEKTGLSGQSEDDERAYVGEYPCGESLLKLAALLKIDISEDA